jgi:hypothetical protein
MSAVVHAPVTDRVRANTPVPVNHRLDTRAQLRVREAAASAHALKALRGDFEHISPESSLDREER